MTKTFPHIHSPLRRKLFDIYRMNEADCVEHLINSISLTSEQHQHIEKTAETLVQGIRARKNVKRGLDSFMHEYDLSTDEGIALMCLAEALLRIPDKGNIDKLIKDKLSKADWEAHSGKSSSVFVNAATWGLMLTGKIYGTEQASESKFGKIFRKMLEKSGEPVVRTAVKQAMRILGKQFVMGQTIEEAIQRAEKYEAQGYRFSYDMLGEAARTAKDAERYFRAYQDAIAAIRKAAKQENMIDNPGVSVKLSALHPRYEVSKADVCVPAITEKLLVLAQQCKEGNISLIVDAEEAERLDLSLEIIENVFGHASLKGWNGFGLAVQSYQKRAWYLLDWLIELAETYQKRWLVRLIKGAYWDSEIKLTQEKGLENYPVFTRKVSTDISFLACAQKILAHTDAIYPMFASHNASSVASIFEMAGTYRDFEFQCLHGMGANLYDQIVSEGAWQQPCRVYAPVGTHEDLLPYLVRRLLENGANSSFVNRISDESLPIQELVRDPIEKLRSLASVANPKIPLPIDLFKVRQNSLGTDLSNATVVNEIQQKLQIYWEKDYYALPSNRKKSVPMREGAAIYDPNQLKQQIGWVEEAKLDDVEQALVELNTSFRTWDAQSVEYRAAILEQMAKILEEHKIQLMALLIREAGKTWADAIAEVREAVDFCHYYAMQARQALGTQILPGPTGESNVLEFQGRGIFLCISPWNFPLAIFTGQVAAALVAGNAVVAKPAEQTPLIADLAVRLFYQAGVPEGTLHLLPGKGETIGAALVQDLRVQGILFTGSTETAQIIQKSLAERGGPIIPFIAETGGQNALIADSSALLEQVVQDTLTSAFYSAGQRCSALRVLFIQEEVADRFCEMLVGAMAELRVGNTADFSTDIGPVIDTQAQTVLRNHFELMQQQARLLYQVSLPEICQGGTFFAPCAFEIHDIAQLQREVFGPILHVIRYSAKNLDGIIEGINKTGYGLTFGIHSRIEDTVQKVVQKVRAGNCYVNRNMVGAVVGVQPFGGEGISGTGPKAGGPQYLYRLCTEKTISINTTAAGGNASLMAMDDKD